MRFFKAASIKYDKPEVPEAPRGLCFVLKLPANGEGRMEGSQNADPFAASVVTNSVVPVISALSARFINLYDALKLVCDVTGMKFKIKDGIIWIMPPIQPCDELITRIYPVLTSLCDGIRVSGSSHEDDSNRQDWKIFFRQMGVNWPEGPRSAIWLQPV